MTPFEYHLAQRRPEGIYHFRFYTVPVGIDTRIRSHFLRLIGVTNYELDGDLITSWNPLTVEGENEIEQGIPNISQLQLELEPDPAFRRFIQASRSKQYDLWVEVALEPTHAIGTNSFDDWRMYYWGRLDRKTMHGDVLKQNRDVLTRKNQIHDGKLTMAFTSWIKIKSEAAVKEFLDTRFVYNADGVGHYINAESFLFGMMATMIPVDQFDLFSMNGGDLVRTRIAFGSKASLVYDPKGQARIVMPDGRELVSNNGVASYLDKVAFRSTNPKKNTLPSPLFNFDPKGNGDASLYNMKDMASLLTAYLREWGFTRWNIELPTFEQVGRWKHGFSQPLDAPAKAIILGQFDAPLPLYVTSADEIGYDPCASWASKYEIDQPTGKDLQPEPNKQTASGPFAGGATTSYRTLLRFVGYVFNSQIPTLDLRGIEIYIDAGAPWGFEYATTVLALGNSVTSQSWPAFHAHMGILAWGNVRAMITFTADGIGLHPFGASGITDSKAPAQDFGLYDFGFWPLARYVDALPGLFGDEIAEDGSDDDLANTRRFAVISMERVSGGPSTGRGRMSVKAVEISSPWNSGYGETITEPVQPPPPPPIDPPPPTDPPTTTVPNEGPITSGPQSGLLMVQVQAVNTYGVAQAKLYMDGVLVDTQVGTTVSGNQARVNDVFQFQIDTTKFTGTIGTPVSHTLKAVAFDIAGNSSSHSFTFYIAN